MLEMRFPVWRELKRWSHQSTEIGALQWLEMRFPVWRELKPYRWQSPLLIPFP